MTAFATPGPDTATRGGQATAAWDRTGEPPEGASADWLGLFGGELPVARAAEWVVTPGCGAVVTFTGTVRDHSEGRSGVVSLDYEAYAEQVEPRMAEVARTARDRWPEIGRLVLLHRIGRLEVTDAAVVVAVSTPNRPAAFEAARWCIDTVKATVPIWKRETWEGGEDWGTCEHDLVGVDDLERHPHGDASTEPPDPAS